MLCCKNTSRPKKFTVCGIVAMVSGVFLILIAIVLPIIIYGVLRSSVPPQVAVSRENEDLWSALPGDAEIEIIKQHIVYNVTNPEEIVLDGARPKIVQMDPIPYLTVENYHDINYTKVQIPSDPKQNERNAAVYRYTSSNPLYNNTDVFPVPEDYNKTITVINPTALGVWLSLKQAPKWRTQLGALYSVTVDGLGNSLLKTIAFNLMVDENFGTSEAVKASLWPASDDVSVDVKKAKYMREDKTYGLNNPDNVAKWAALCSIDPVEKIEFQNEIFTYFGLSTITIMEEATNNF